MNIKKNYKFVCGKWEINLNDVDVNSKRQFNARLGGPTWFFGALEAYLKNLALMVKNGDVSLDNFKWRSKECIRAFYYVNKDFTSMHQAWMEDEGDYIRTEWFAKDVYEADGFLYECVFIEKLLLRIVVDFVREFAFDIQKMHCFNSSVHQVLIGMGVLNSENGFYDYLWDNSKLDEDINCPLRPKSDCLETFETAEDFEESNS